MEYRLKKEITICTIDKQHVLINNNDYFIINDTAFAIAQELREFKSIKDLLNTLEHKLTNIDHDTLEKDIKEFINEILEHLDTKIK